MARWVVGAALGIGWSEATISDDCTAAFAEMETGRGQIALTNMALASAQGLPYDAGKWVMCDSMKNDPDYPAKYHLVTVDASIPAPTKDEPNNRYSHAMEYGICLPAACSKEDVKNFATVDRMVAVLHGFTPLLANKALSFDNVVSHSRDDLYDVRSGMWVAISVVALLTLLIIFSTGLHIHAQNKSNRRQVTTDEGNAQLLEAGGEAPRPKPGLESNLLFSAFSLIGPNGTWDKLWAMAPYRDTDCLNGARVLSMFWVVMGHSFIMSEGIVGYQNPQDIVQSPLNQNAAETNWAFMFVLNAQMSVDTFFFLGGFLFSLGTLAELKKTNGKFKHVMALMLRYLRLTPSLAFVMLIYYQIWPFLASGPFAARFQNSVFRRCDLSWWSELTYTLNFIPFNSDDVCMGWTWYLGDDMIFFIIGILLVPVYYKWRPVGWAALVLMTAASCCVTAWLVLKYHLAPEALDEHYQEYSLYAYSKPYTRIPVYFVGIASGWILLAMERKGVTKETGWVGPIVASLLWLFAIGMTTTITLIPATDHGYRKNTWSDIQSMIFLTFSRPMWGVCWAIITFLCYYGHAPITNAILSHKFWTPFVRLTYGAYLCHPLVIKLAGGCAVQYYTFSGMDLLYRMVGNTLLAYSASFAVWCYIERPMMTFTTALLKGQQRSKPKSESAADKPVIEEAGNKPLVGK